MEDFATSYNRMNGNNHVARSQRGAASGVNQSGGASRTQLYRYAGGSSSEEHRDSVQKKKGDNYILKGVGRFTEDERELAALDACRETAKPEDYSPPGSGARARNIVNIYM